MAALCATLRIGWILALMFAGQSALAQESLRFHLVKGAGAAHAIGELCCDRNAYPLGPPINASFSGYGARPFWIKVEPLVGGDVLQIVPILHRVILYMRARGSDEWRSWSTGTLVAGRIKPLDTAFIAFPLAEDTARQTLNAKKLRKSIYARYIWDCICSRPDRLIWLRNTNLRSDQDTISRKSFRGLFHIPFWS